MVLANQVTSNVVAFLRVATPEAWTQSAAARIPELLNDHANCELKAASTALSFIYRYPERASLCKRMSRLAREELRHYEQVRKHMEQLAVPFIKLSASRYASRLRDAQRQREPERLLDSLLIGALIEARSCERFAALAPCLDAPLKDFYVGLLRSEARHFENYLQLAHEESECEDGTIDARLAELKGLEADLIVSPDVEFRFHSGAPLVA